MRDLKSYEQSYNKPGFEEIQVKYRRKKVIEELKKYNAKRIIEIGTGMKPIFLYYKHYDKYCFFEPAKDFYHNAIDKVKTNGYINIEGYNENFIFKEEVRDMNPDFIICASLLHELEKPEDVVRDIYKTANTKTIIHFNVPNARSLHRLLAKSMNLIQDEKQFSSRNIKLQQNHVYDIDSFIKLITILGG